MKTKILLLGSALTAFTFTTFAADALLSPRAQDNQPKVFISSTETPSTTIAYVAPGTALLTPRATDNQSKIVQGMVNDSNRALACAKMMNGTPKTVAEC